MEEIQKVERYKNLLSAFVSLPKSNTNPTFMDICQMGGDRFEERCSQILKFFLTPSMPHNFNGLFLSSLLEIIGHEELNFSNKTTQVLTEEMTDDRKFIDLTILADDFVLAIENKIGADLYNPLDSYVNHIKSTYKNVSTHLFVVLSVRRIVDEAEIRKMSEAGYMYVNYEDLFNTVKSKLGYYALDADQSYLTFLIDFIRTIENRYYSNKMELRRFFYDKNNGEIIENLIHEYESFKQGILSLQKEQIAVLKTRICDRTNAAWWVYQGWDLGISFNDNGHRLGIESSFNDSTIDNPLGNFHIYITVWKKKDFAPYESYLKKEYPECKIDYNAVDGSRIFLHLPVIEGNNSDEIIDKLAECYNVIKTITDMVK